MFKTAIVTGASRGIGREVAIALAQKHHRVIAIARSQDDLKTLQLQYPDKIYDVALDLTHQEKLNGLETRIRKDFSGIDILINNAGALINKPFEKLTRQDWQTMLDANLMSAVNLTRTLLPQMNKESHIVNISSMGGFQGSRKFPGLTAYSVAKGAVSILSECLAAAFAERQISVNALCLGSVQTEMFNRAFPDFEADVNPKTMGTYIADFALNGATFYNGKVVPVALNDPS